jgi:hypothetical protein
VAVAVGQVYQGGKDACGDFIRKAARGDRPDGYAAFSGTHGYACLTADGKFLANDPERALKVWKSLPEGERKPGAVTVPDDGPPDPKVAQPTPPPNGLILRLFYRNLARTPDGALRLATQDDYRFGSGRVNLDSQPNYLWLTEAEWKSLIPADPKKGQHVRVADAIADRICLQYLHPVLAFCACSGWGKDQRRGQELRLTVEDVTDRHIRLRLDGSARFGAPYVRERADDLKGPFGYEPTILGFVEYDRKAQRVTRFDFVALGDMHGYPNTDDAAWRPSWRPGRQPLGVAFELVSGNAPADRVPARVVPSGP